MNKERILIVEDEYFTSTDIRNMLVKFGYDVIGIADTGADAIEMAGAHRPDLVLMDITLKGHMNGIEAAKTIRKRFGIPVIYLTAHSDDATIEKAVVSEPFGYLIKPIDERALQTTIQMALYKHAMDRKMEEQNQELTQVNEDLLKFTAAIDGMDDCVIITKKTGEIEYVNTAFIKRFGYTADEMKGKYMSDLQAPENRFPIRKEVFIEDPKSVWTGNFYARNKFGIQFHTALKSTPLKKDSEVISRVFVLREQTGI
jgi:PAS domain S-box-containing protein